MPRPPFRFPNRGVVPPRCSRRSTRAKEAQGDGRSKKQQTALEERARKGLSGGPSEGTAPTTTTPKEKRRARTTAHVCLISVCPRKLRAQRTNPTGCSQQPKHPNNQHADPRQDPHSEATERGHLQTQDKPSSSNPESSPDTTAVKQCYEGGDGRACLCVVRDARSSCMQESSRYINTTVVVRVVVHAEPLS
jgi:hypothetical protein